MLLILFPDLCVAPALTTKMREKSEECLAKVEISLRVPKIEQENPPSENKVAERCFAIL